MSLSVFHYCICACLRRCRSFNPSLRRLSPFHVLCRCFKAVSLVGIYPNRASLVENVIDLEIHQMGKQKGAGTEVGTASMVHKE